VPCLNLNPDRYYLSLWLASVGPKYYDQLELCLTLDVEPADVHNSGRSMAKYFGLVFLPCQWRNHESVSRIGSCELEEAGQAAAEPAA
jgi:hypothetical protein